MSKCTIRVLEQFLMGGHIDGKTDTINFVLTNDSLIITAEKSDVSLEIDGDDLKELILLLSNCRKS